MTICTTDLPGRAMLDLDGRQPPDWMCFARTQHVTWRDVQSMARRHRRRIARDYDLLVAILRAGSPVAALVALQTGLPIDYLVCSRRHPDPCFLDGEARAPRGRRILLVDDVCGSGWTFARCRQYCAALENRVGTFSVYRCDAPGMYVPDFSMPARADEYLRWPWEYQQESEMPQRQRRAAPPRAGQPPVSCTSGTASTASSR